MYYGKLIQFVVFVSVPLAMFSCCFSREIIASLFQRGSFDVHSVEIAANCLKVFAFSMPLTCLFMVNGRACESFQRLKMLSLFGALGNLLMILLTAVMIDYLGYLGIPSARLAMDVLYFLPFGFIALHSFDKTLKLLLYWKSAAKALLAAALPQVLYVYSGVAARLDGCFPSLFVLGAVFAGFAVIYGVLLFAMTRGRLVLPI